MYYVFQKGSMNFSLYCSDWTSTNINYKKLVLLSMYMNDSEKSTVKMSRRRVVNLEMFGSVRIYMLNVYTSYVFMVPYIIMI